MALKTDITILKPDGSHLGTYSDIDLIEKISAKSVTFHHTVAGKTEVIIYHGLPFKIKTTRNGTNSNTAA